MSLELCLFGVGLEATLANEKAAYYEIWLAEAMKAAWVVWSSLGWNNTEIGKIQKGDWTDLNAEDTSIEIINHISHFLRATEAQSFDISASYKMGWSYILRIVDLIIQKEIFLEPCDPVDAFRLSVARFITVGIKEGLDNPTSTFHEFFLNAVRKRINYDFTNPTDLEISFSNSETETTVTVLSPQHNVNILNCDCTVINV